MSCHRNIQRIYCSTDRQKATQSASWVLPPPRRRLPFPPLQSHHIHTAVCSFSSFPSLLIIRESLPSRFHPSTALEPWGLKIDLINIACFDRFNINAKIVTHQIFIPRCCPSLRLLSSLPLSLPYTHIASGATWK